MATILIRSLSRTKVRQHGARLLRLVIGNADWVTLLVAHRVHLKNVLIQYTFVVCY